MSVYVKDRLEFVRESVQSILDQTFRDFHYFLICDGPEAPEVDGYLTSLKDDRIRLFRFERNRGLAHALNYLLEIIMKNPEYKFIARMDADDISLSERFQKQREFLISNPDISCVGCWYEEINEEGNLLNLRRLPTNHESLRKRYFTRAPFAHPSVLFRRELIEVAGFYPANTILMEDNALWGNALINGLKFSNIPEYLLKFRIDKGYYQRRSGFRYGAKYIKTRIGLFHKLNAPLYAFIVLICTGFVKMLPSVIIRPIYRLLQ